MWSASQALLVVQVWDKANRGRFRQAIRSSLKAAPRCTQAAGASSQCNLPALSRGWQGLVRSCNKMSEVGEARQSSEKWCMNKRECC